MVETIDEPVEVLTLFRDGKVEPLRFRWRRKVVRISRVTGDWVSSRTGRDRVHYYSVLGDGSDYFELSFHTRTFQWTLTRVWMDG